MVYWMVGQETSKKIGRCLIRKTFYTFAGAKGSKARVVCEDGAVGGADGREKLLCLIPNAVGHNVLLKYAIKTSEARNCPPRTWLESVLKREKDYEDDVTGSHRCHKHYGGGRHGHTEGRIRMT